ncbi:MAG: ribosomal protein S18-alanine N-acetyltransferase [Alphaproteobacteria bacterium]|jgi:ribosomal-protein-alanine N-acetyltransferase
MPEIIRRDDSFAAVYAALHAACFDKAWNEPAMRQILRMPGAFGFLAVEKDEVAGFILCSRATDEAEIVSVGVRPEFRRTGMAERLIHEAFSTARRQGARVFFLEVAVDNPAAVALYEKTGFRKVGKRKGYYERGDERIDALVMRADL